MSALNKKNEDILNMFSLVNAFLLSLSKETRTSFYTEEYYQALKEVVIDDSISIQGRLSPYKRNNSLKYYQVVLTIVVDNVKTVTYRYELNSLYYSRFKTIQDYVWKESIVHQKLLPQNMEKLNVWSKQITLPQTEDECKSEQLFSIPR